MVEITEKEMELEKRPADNEEQITIIEEKGPAHLIEVNKTKTE